MPNSDQKHAKSSETAQIVAESAFDVLSLQQHETQVAAQLAVIRFDPLQFSTGRQPNGKTLEDTNENLLGNIHFARNSINDTLRDNPDVVGNVLKTIAQTQTPESVRLQAANLVKDEVRSILWEEADNRLAHMAADDATLIASTSSFSPAHLKAEDELRHLVTAYPQVAETSINLLKQHSYHQGDKPYPEATESKAVEKIKAYKQAQNRPFRLNNSDTGIALAAGILASNGNDNELKPLAQSMLKDCTEAHPFSTTINAALNNLSKHPRDFITPEGSPEAAMALIQDQARLAGIPVKSVIGEIHGPVHDARVSGQTSPGQLNGKAPRHF